jgi:DNA-binding SARP family transcriptional activator
MEFLVLGPLEVRRDDEPVEVRGSKRRALLALLILHANEVVRTDRLVDELWGEHPPANASAALQNHVSRLRKDLGGDVLVTKPWGYVLRADPQTIDLLRFEALVAEARTLAAHERRERLGEALALWRGPALADVASEPALVTEVARLEELRLSALEQRIDTDLELGGDPDLVAELETLVARYPLRERLRGQLILALYRAGRQAEALEAYRETRRVLVEELGIEPGPELRELEQAILRQDPALVVAPPPATVPPDEPPHWRWPRSPIAIAAALLLLFIAGGAAAALVVRGGGPDNSEAAAVPASSTREDTTTSATTAAERPIVITTVRKEEPEKPSARSGGGKPKPGTTATTGGTTSREDPADPPPPPPQHPTTVTRTEPATTKTTTTTRQPADRDWVYWLTDDFEDPGFDSGMWNLFREADTVAATEDNGRLELAIAPDAGSQGGNISANYSTQCWIGDDFDAQVEFKLLTWPPKSGVIVSLSPYLEGAPQPTTVGVYAGSPTIYTSNISGHMVSVQTAETSGALRVARDGPTMSTYYRYRGSWVRLDSRRLRGRLRLMIGVYANGSDFGHQPVVVAFDNFRATVSEKPYSLECMGVPYPPRKPPP